MGRWLGIARVLSWNGRTAKNDQATPNLTTETSEKPVPFAPNSRDATHRREVFHRPPSQ